MKIQVEFDQLDIPFDMQFGNWLPASPGEPKAVLFVPQDLTPEQQAQARKNIGAAAVGEGGGSLSAEIIDNILVVNLPGNLTASIQNGVLTVA